MTPGVCIILVNWNGWKDTVACLGSLRHLSHPNRHVIVVDNASSNDSVARIRTAHPDVEVIENSVNLGFGGGNNVGIRVALKRGAQFVWLLNTDTIVEPSTLDALVRCAHAEHADIVGSVLTYADQPGVVQAWGGGRVDMLTGRSTHNRTEAAADQTDYVVAASMLVSRNVFERIGLFDEAIFLYWEDTDFSFTARKAGFKLAVAKDARVVHKESASLGKRSAVLDYYFTQSSMIFFRKHGRFGLLPVLVGAVRRATVRAIQGDWRRALAVLRPLLSTSTPPRAVRPARKEVR